MSVNPPDTITFYKHGGYAETNAGHEYLGKQQKTNDDIAFQVVNGFGVHTDKRVTVSNDVYVPDNVTIRVLSKNPYHNLFWGSTEYIGLIFYGIVLIILIKLVNRYLDRKFFETKSFTLISMFGVLLIVNEGIDFIVNMINIVIFQHPSLNTTELMSKRFHSFSYVTIHPAHISFSNIVIGVLIIFLAQIIKEAIATKQEQDLTI